MDENIKKDSIEKATSPAAKAEEAEDNSALDSFLSREQEPTKPVKTGKNRKPILIVIIALVVVAALVVTLILVRRRTYQKSEGVTDPAEITLDASATVGKITLSEIAERETAQTLRKRDARVFYLSVNKSVGIMILL